MPPLFKVDQVLRGHKLIYTVVKEIHRAFDEAAVYLARDQNKNNCIVKSVRGHWRLQNEADILRRYQSKMPFLRPIIDEVISPADPPSIVLRHLDSELLAESRKKRLTRPEIKQVARCILEALLVLHKDGMVHTDSKFAKECNVIRGAFTRSPEVMLALSWGPPTDVYLVHGGDFHRFDPGWQRVKTEDQDYELTVMQRMYHSFGPFQRSMADILNPVALDVVFFLNWQGNPRKPLQRWSMKEIPSADNEFIRQILQLDPRERPIWRRFSRTDGS
ncbi:hypothetical protein COCVIDRAFT_32963 [Bipolaris victoriae FI3]|uniref:Protein kinase domain-containing protein n=1 Tax=Bipolaris victoriae (strain FI3) TaxID=930091 RepID=W7EQ21_BIPV3|nr:hypothetical protein COCVIDRAFT_32963 [Bipolaris victoriae FI3]